MESRRESSHSAATPPHRKFPQLFRSLAAAAVIAGVAVTPSFAQPAAEPSHQLGEVVVTAAGFEQALIEAPASITVITREELERKEITSIADALRGIEGVNVNFLDARDGKTGNQSISLRGLPREYTLILIDGVRQNPMGNVTPNSFNDSQSVFIPPVAAIERIEVIRGPMSSLYGSDALGGVVNIITRKPGKEWGGTVSLSNTFQFDSEFGGKSALDAYASGPVLGDSLSLQLYGRLFERAESNIDIPGVVSPRPLTSDSPTMGQNPVGANIYTAGGKLFFTPSAQHEVSLGFNITEQKYDNSKGDIGALSRTGNPAGSACNTIPAPNFCRGYEDELIFSRNQVTLGYISRLDLGTIETKVTRDFLETEGRTIPLNSGLDPAIEGSPRKLELETYIVDTKFVAPISNHILTVGGQYIDPKMTDGIWGGGSNSVSQYSLFVEDEWRIFQRLALTGGLRYDNNEAYSGKFNPRAYAVWNATDSWTFKGGVARGYRTPFLEQLTDGIIGFGVQGTVPLFGNPGLGPETSTNYEIAALFHGGPRFSAQTTVFRNELKNLIERGTGANSGRDINFGEARIQGVELAARYGITRTVALSGNYTYIDSEVTETQLAPDSIVRRAGDPLVSVPDHMVNATLSWQATPQLGTFLSAEYRSRSFRPRNFPEPQNGGNAQGVVDVDGVFVRDSNLVMGNFKGYTLLNLGASYAFTRNVTLNGTIYNLLDKDFKDYREFPICTAVNQQGVCTAAGTGFSNAYNNILEPRRLWVSLNVAF